MHLKDLVSGLRVAPGTKVDLAANHDPGYKAGWKRKDAEHHEQELGLYRMADFQDRLAAQGSDALLVVLQGIDAAGKDGTISHVMRGVNPQGVTVHSFKVPSAEELRHDYLWRYQCALPAVGQVGIFN